jgi:hypothetical protein
MKAPIYVTPLLAAFFCTPTLAIMFSSGESPNFQANSSVIANTYVSGGDSAVVYGNVIAKTYASTGNGSIIHGDFRSGDVTTLGYGATVNGNVESKGAGNAGANTLITGDLVTGGVGTMGASAHVEGNFISGLAGTIGANAILEGNWEVGVGSIAAASASSNKINSDAVDTDIEYLNSVQANLDSDMITATNELIGAKAALSDMTSTELTLSPTFVTDGTLFAGVYDAASWSTAAGTTLTLDGQGLDDAIWIFNIDDVLAFGSDSTVELVNAGSNAQVFWNIGSVSSPGGYASLGDGADVLGIIIAEDYVTVGANATVMHASEADGNCAGIYSTTSYVSIGANAIVGSDCLPCTFRSSMDIPFFNAYSALSVPSHPVNSSDRIEESSTLRFPSHPVNSSDGMIESSPFQH